MIRSCVDVALLQSYENTLRILFAGTKTETSEGGRQLVGTDIGNHGRVMTETVHSLKYCSVNLERGRGLQQQMTETVLSLKYCSVNLEQGRGQQQQQV